MGEIITRMLTWSGAWRVQPGPGVLSTLGEVLDIKKKIIILVEHLTLVAAADRDGEGTNYNYLIALMAFVSGKQLLHNMID